MREVDALMAVRPDVIAMDATERVRPGGLDLKEFFRQVKEKYPDMIFMADCSCFEDAKRAQELGFDIAGTTMRGYTEATKGKAIPDFDMIHQMTHELTIRSLPREESGKQSNCGEFSGSLCLQP